MPLERILDIQVKCLLVEDCCGSVFVLVSPASYLDHPFHKRDNKLRVLLGHHIGTGDNGGDVGHLQGPVRIPGQILDRLHFARRFLKMLEGFALSINGIDLAFQQRCLQRTEGQVVFVVTP